MQTTTKPLPDVTTLAALLQAAYDALIEEGDRQERDVFARSCPNCHGVPMAHSLGCKIENALAALKKAGVTK